MRVGLWRGRRRNALAAFGPGRVGLESHERGVARLQDYGARRRAQLLSGILGPVIAVTRRLAVLPTLDAAWRLALPLGGLHAAMFVYDLAHPGRFLNADRAGE